ncbi:MAG: MATE family efflux transporter [Elusimicrobiota bacterium]|nr:MATE family efflux transporter [Elusimicrobiota bacterium]
MKIEFPWPEARSVLKLAGPIALTQIGMVLYGTVDMLFVGRLGPVAIASVGLGSMTYFTCFVVGMGIVMGIDSHSSKAFGAGRPDLCGQLLVHTLVLALAVALPAFFLCGLAGWAFRLIGVDPRAAEGAVEYLSILRWGVFPGLCFVACRQFLQSMSVTTPLLVAIVAGNLVNAALDYLLIFGSLGAPRLGVPGSAYASLAANVVMFAAVAFASWSRLRAIAFKFHGWHRRLFWDVAKLGLPGGAAMAVEVAVFSLATALVGRLGAEVLAAHQLTLNLASLTFMIPMGLSHAAATRVGQALGRGEPWTAAAAGNAATAMSVVFMACTGLIFAVFPEPILGLFGADAALVARAKPLLYCGAAFQIFDGAQAVLTGALRGLGETRRPLYINVLAHWLIGLPVGLTLAFGLGWGAVGVWIGLVAGLASVALLLGREWRRLTYGLPVGGQCLSPQSGCVQPEALGPHS